MNAKDLKRLMELMSKQATLTEPEKSELSALQAKAAAVKDTDEELSGDQVKTLVSDAVKAALTANPAASAADVKIAVDAAIAKIPAASVIDTKAIVDQVVAAMPKSASAEDIKKLIEDGLKTIRRPSRMQHETGEDELVLEFPIAHKSGNLSVAQKQLLNVMTLGKRQPGIELGDDILNAGIPESIVKAATERGARAEKALLHKISRSPVMDYKAITAGGAGSGQEFMNFSLSSVLLQRLYLESLLAQAMIARELQMPTNPFTLPLSTTRPVFQAGIAENAGPTASNNGSASNVLTAAKLMGMSQYSDEADEDSIIAILPMLTDQLGQAAADALENAIINGDTAGTMDTGVPANDSSLLFDGVRKLALAQASLKISLATGGISAANYGALRKALGKWGMKPADLCFVVGTNAYNDTILLPETLTAEKAGNQATARILTGQAPQIFGIDIIPSAQVRENLNAVGVFDNTTITKGSILLLHKPSWIQGVRKGFTLETFRDPRVGSQWVVASFRRAFKPLESLANTKAAAIGINYNS